jgi:hypothetical protein
LITSNLIAKTEALLTKKKSFYVYGSWYIRRYTRRVPLSLSPAKLSIHFSCVKPRNKRIEFPFSFHQQALDSVSCVKTKKQEKNRLPKKSLPKTADLDKSNKSLSMKTSWPWASTMMPF